MRRDFRAEAVRRMVVIGESNAYGMCASDPQNEWVQVLANNIRSHQNGYLRVLNNAIPSNCISPSNPGYIAFDGHYATAPSALERYREDVIAHDPDLAIFAYGLNDSHAGHGVESFIRDYEQIVKDTRKHLSDSLIVLVGPYWNPQYDRDLWLQPKYEQARTVREAAGIGRSGDDLVTAYIEEIHALAGRYDCLFIDLYNILKGASWLIHNDACHYTDVGQAVIGMAVFTDLAANCSFLASKSTAAYREGGFSTNDTGGTNSLPGVVASWRYHEGLHRPESD